MSNQHMAQAEATVEFQTMLQIDQASYQEASTRSAEILLVASTEEWQAEQTAQAIKRAMEHLTATQLKVVELHYFQGHKAREIAQELGMPTNTVLQHLRRARHRLSTWIEWYRKVLSCNT